MDELRLLLVVLLNAAVLTAAYRLARRRGGGGRVQAACDTLLLYFLVQYAAVAIPGIFGVFNTATMAGMAVAFAGAMWISGGGLRAVAPAQAPDADAPGGWDPDRLGLLACTLFVGAFVLGYAYIQRYIPPMATDPLVYHLPTAVQWMRTGKLGIFPTWYWNPAASYSPATGSTFMAWWMAPAGNDLFVRFVQVPPLLLIFFLIVRLCRLLGCGRTLAGLIAVAATVSRPLFSEAVVQKDDLYVTAFVLSAVVALSREPLRDRLGGWRLGIAAGFVLASKYTVLLVCPVFLFLIDAPFRAGWTRRRFLLAAGLVLVIAGPWYLRNALLTGNPLYPVDVRLPGIHWAGLFGTERDQQLRAAGGVWRMVSGTYFSIPAPLLVPLAAGWLWALWAGRGLVVRDPLARACTVGSVATLLIFLFTSPHHELRYIFPLIALWFGAAGLGLARVKPAALGILIAGALAIVSALTSFEWGLVVRSADLIAGGLAAALAGTGLILVLTRTGRGPKPGRRGAILAGATAALVLSAVAYVQWHAYVQSCREARPLAWQTPGGYPLEAPVWGFVNDHLPPDATVAYANDFYVYPYMGFDYTRRVVYAPVRRGLHDFLHFPRMGDKVPGDLIVQTMTRVQDQDADFATWTENLDRLGARYLVVARRGIDPAPPELALARRDPARFIRVYEDGYATVYRIERAK